MKKSLIFMACVGVIALAFTACHREDGFSAGSEMSADQIRAYREKLLAENLAEAAPPEVTPPSTPSEPVSPSTPPVTEEGEDMKDGGAEELPEICYYVENGSVWHVSNSCSYIKNSKNVIQDDVEGAQAAGKTRPCSKCASNWQ